MPENKDFKRRVRARMAKTGESYTAARRELVKSPDAAAAEAAPQEAGFWRVAAGMQGAVRSITYPFERLTHPARRALGRAEALAAAEGRPYIGTEHLLLALLDEDGVAALALRNCGVTREAVQAGIAARIPPSGPARESAGEAVPTGRVKEAIEIAFQEARRLRSDSVGPEHLLLGIVIQGENVAASVLAQLGADLERLYDGLKPLEDVRVAQLRDKDEARPGASNEKSSVLSVHIDPQRARLRAIGEIAAVIDAAIAVASEQQAAHVSAEHLRIALNRQPDRDERTSAEARELLRDITEAFADYFLAFYGVPATRVRRSRLVDNLVDDILSN